MPANAGTKVTLNVWLFEPLFLKSITTDVLLPKSVENAARPQGRGVAGGLAELDVATMPSRHSIRKFTFCSSCAVFQLNVIGPWPLVLFVVNSLIGYCAVPTEKIAVFLSLVTRDPSDALGVIVALIVFVLPLTL